MDNRTQVAEIERQAKADKSVAGKMRLEGTEPTVMEKHELCGDDRKSFDVVVNKLKSSDCTPQALIQRHTALASCPATISSAFYSNDASSKRALSV